MSDGLVEWERKKGLNRGSQTHSLQKQDRKFFYLPFDFLEENTCSSTWKSWKNKGDEKYMVSAGQSQFLFQIILFAWWAPGPRSL